MPLQASDDYYRAQQRRQLATLAAVMSEWQKIGSDFDSGWARVGPRISMLVTASQVGAAREGFAYVGEALAEQSITSSAAVAFAPEALTGAYTLDGVAIGSLDDLLYGAVVDAKTASADALSARVDAGSKYLHKVVPSQVADASRTAVGEGITARRRVGWTRLVSPPCCMRCAVLAGKYFVWNTGFQRHPRCDCRHVPTTDQTFREAGYTIGPDDVKDLTKAQRRAVDDGADMNQVINAHRKGERSKDGMTTTEGVTRRGVAGRRLQEQSGTKGKKGRYLRSKEARLTPEAIYRVSASREEAIALLKKHGYVL